MAHYINFPMIQSFTGSGSYYTIMKKMFPCRVSVFNLCVFLWFAWAPAALCEKNEPRAIKGAIDLSAAAFDQNGIAKLDGEWEIYVGKLYTPADFASGTVTEPVGYIKVPSNIAGQVINGKPIPNMGCVTYRLKANLPKSVLSTPDVKKMLGLYIIEVHAAYDLWINGVLMLRQGVASPDPEKFVALLRPRRVLFSTPTDSIEIVINNVNYFDNKIFGADDHIYLGNEQDILSYMNKKQFFYIFSFGVLLLAAIYHLFLFFNLRNEKIYLSFGLLALLLSLQSVVESERVIHYVLAGISTELVFKIWFISLNLFPAILLFYRHLYPKETNTFFLRLTTGIFGSFTLLVIVTPYSFYCRLVDYLFLYGFVVIGYLFYVSFKAIRAKREYAVLTFIGMCIPFIVGINDLLFGLDYIVTGYYSPVAFLIYVVFQSYILTLKFSKTYQNNQRLSDELIRINESLEKTVLERTDELQLANAELQQTNSAKDKFLSIISHDLKNPFHILLGYTELLKEDLDDLNKSEIHSMASAMHETASTSYKLLENLLDWSRLQLGAYKPVPSVVSLNALANTTFQFLTQQAAVKNITLKADFDREYQIFADAKMMEAVLRNLISNAIKFTHQGGEVSVSGNQSGKTVELHVADNGVGMEEELLEKLFRLNEKVSRKGTANESGTGFGLLLVREFVEKNGGELTVKSEPGKGSVFTIRMPSA